MRPEAMDQRVHDYLDGRLGSQERSDFEARMAADPELAGRVGAYRKIRSALRHGSSELPPGFLARARARFEALHAPRPMWRRYLSWETVGLVTAGVVVLALTIPLGQRAPVVLDVPTSGEKRDLAGAPAEEPPKEVAAAPPDLRSDERGGEAKQDRPALAKPTPLGHGRTGRREKGPLPPAVPPAGSVSAGTTSERGTQALVPAAARSAASPERSVAAVESAAGRAKEGQPVETRCQELPMTAGLAPGLVAVVASADEPSWEELRRGAARDALERLAADFRSERVVLIGPRRAPFGCAGMRVVSRAAGMGIQLPRVAGPEDLRGGLVLAIPAGSSPVEIESDVVR